MKRADRLSAVLLLVFAGVLIGQARRLAYWQDYGPGPGFVPLWLGVAIAVLSVVLWGRPTGSRDAAPDWPDRANAVRLVVVAALSMAAAAASTAIGLVLGSAAYMLSALFYLQPERPVRNLAIASLVPFIVWIVFARWLGVPLPKGPMGF